MADDEVRCSLLRAAAAEHGGTIRARRAKDVAKIARRHRIKAAVLDASCLDGGAIEVLEWLRRKRGSVPVLVLCPRRDRFTQKQARERGALCLVEPWGLDDVRTFLSRALGEAPRLVELIARFGSSYALSSREVELLVHLYAEGVPLDAMAAHMRVSRHTVLSWRSRIRHKCGAASFGDVCRLLLLHALTPTDAAS
jgi:DNA-binding NarL/FixJ family response regulator